MRQETRTRCASQTLRSNADILTQTHGSFGGMNRGSLTLAKWCVAFQNGFFWQALMETISSSHRAG